jgi:glycosyltransferase involved in cell wall biosynthesis
VGELLMMSDIFLQTSLSEGLSCTVVEALAAGCPAIVTDVGGNREIVTDGVEGYVVALGDDSALESRVLALAEDEALRAALGNRAGARAREAFSLGAMIDNYERLYEEALDRDRGAQ